MSLRDFFFHRAEHARFRKLTPDQRRIVVYSESGQDWHHFAPVIAALTDSLGETVCYVSSVLARDCAASCSSRLSRPDSV
jgi:hypothetical protein